MKILISACLVGKNVRWNGGNKLNSEIISWAKHNNIQLVPVCPESEILGAPRPPIRLVYEHEEIKAYAKKKNIKAQLDLTCNKIIESQKDAVGFIGISKSPTCGISVGVKNLGRTIKGPMHDIPDFPTVEVSQIKSEKQRNIFLERIKKFVNERNEDII